MKKKTKLIYMLLSIALIACSNDSENDLEQAEEPNGALTYTTNIKAIISGNCLGCHSSPPRNGAPFSLVTYEQVKSIAENGSLLNAISKQTSENGSMPPANRMPQATIDRIDQWIQEGTLEN